MLPLFGLSSSRAGHMIHEVFVGEHESLRKSRASLLVLTRAMLSLMQIGVTVSSPTLVMMLSQSCRHNLVGTAVDVWRMLAKRNDVTLTSEQLNAVMTLVCTAANKEVDPVGRHANQLLELVLDGIRMHLNLNSDVEKSVENVFCHSMPVTSQWWVSSAQDALKRLRDTAIE